MCLAGFVVGSATRTEQATGSRAQERGNHQRVLNKAAAFVLCEPNAFFAAAFYSNSSHRIMKEATGLWPF